METTQKLEDITSGEYLEKSLENAKKWCQMHLPKYLRGFQDGFDYESFHYIIDDKMIIPDMCWDNQDKGLIRVSIRKLKWYQEREQHFKKHGMLRYARIGDERIRIEGNAEVDPESMFVHEITEFIVHVVPEVLLQYFSEMKFPHSVAYQIENMNRKERGLKLWPEY